MVPMAVHHIAGIGGGLPDVGGEEVVLRRVGPIVEFPGMAVVHALDLLEEDDVRTQCAQLVAQLMHHHALAKLREALVNIIGDDVQFQVLHGAYGHASILSPQHLGDPKISACLAGARSWSYFGYANISKFLQWASVAGPFACMAT